MAGKYFLIRSQMHGKVVDIEGGEADPKAGTRCVMWDQKSSHENTNQLFFECPLTGCIRPKVKPEFCLDVDDAGDNCTMVVMPCTYGDRDQCWDVTDNMLVNRLTGKALDIDGASDSDGAECLAWDIHGEVNQKWDFDYQDPVYFYIVSELNNKVLDVEDANPAPGTRAIMWERNEGEPTDNQLWYEDCKGFIRNKLNDYALDTDGDSLHLEPFEEGKGCQRFAYDGQNKCICNIDDRGEVLDIQGEDDSNGAAVCKWNWNEGSHQMWRLEPVHL